jgi:hypothetical protein
MTTHVDTLTVSSLQYEIEQMLAVGSLNGWDFQVLGQAPLPVVPVHLGDWLIVPAQQDSTPVPERTLERIQAVYAAGLRPKGFVVVHEAPKLLPSGIEEAADDYEISHDPPSRRELKKLLKALPGALLIGLLALVGATALAAVLAVVLTGALVVGAIVLLGAAVVAIDPILIAVMEDGTWVEIDRWWTE